ncbi:MAG: hypothetical protein ACRDY2_14015 [Acidimicrobiales bacterium]
MATNVPQSQQYGPVVSNGQATAGMVLGILAVVIEWGGLITLALAILAIAFGGVGLARSKQVRVGHGRAVAGLVLGIIGLVLYFVWGLFSFGIFWFI